jgi:glycosyltransferase involved in cell wall biosynthesis
MPHKMKVSIIICTRNRAESLKETLAAIEKVHVPSDLSAELVVVDNGSTDRTAAIAQEFRLQNMPLRYLQEPRAGKGYAYNTGMAHSAGEVFLFTDDDVRPPRNWIMGMSEPILCGQADGVAGAVRLPPHLERPWLKGELRGWVACTDVIDLHSPGSVAGANMAISRSVTRKVPAFDTELGPGASGFFDEAMFWRQILHAGFRTIGRPDIVVEHHFDEARLKRDSFNDAARKMGRSWSYVYYHWEHGNIRFAAAKVWKYKFLRILHQMRALLSQKQEPDPSTLNTLFQLSLHEEFIRLRNRGIRNYARHALVKGDQHFDGRRHPGQSEFARELREP